MTNFTSPDSNIWFRRRCRLLGPPMRKPKRPGPTPQEREAARSPNPPSACGLCTLAAPKIGHATQHAIYLAIHHGICQEGGGKTQGRKDAKTESGRGMERSSTHCQGNPRERTAQL